MYYVIIVVIIVLVSIDIGPSLIFPIPCIIHVATFSDFVDSEVTATVVHTVVVPVVSYFVNRLVYVVNVANILVIPIDLFQTKLRFSLSSRLFSLVCH